MLSINFSLSKYANMLFTNIKNIYISRLGSKNSHPGFKCGPNESLNHMGGGSTNVGPNPITNCEVRTHPQSATVQGVHGTRIICKKSPMLGSCTSNQLLLLFIFTNNIMINKIKNIYLIIILYYIN